MVYNTVYTVKKEISKDEFLRQLLYDLASENGTPPDVVDAKFRPVEEDVEEVIVCTAHIEMDYSASIGYDREGKHWTADEQIKSKDLGERTEYRSYYGVDDLSRTRFGRNNCYCIEWIKNVSFGPQYDRIRHQINTKSQHCCTRRGGCE